MEDSRISWYVGARSSARTIESCYLDALAAAELKFRPAVVS